MTTRFRVWGGRLLLLGLTLLAVAVSTIVFTGPIVPFLHVNDGGGDMVYVPDCTVPPHGSSGVFVHIVPLSLHTSAVHAFMSSHVTEVPGPHVPDPPAWMQCSIPLQRRESSQSASAPQRPRAMHPSVTEQVCMVDVSHSESSRTLWHIPPAAQMSCVHAMVSSQSALVMHARVAEQPAAPQNCPEGHVEVRSHTPPTRHRSVVHGR